MAIPKEAAQIYQINKRGSKPVGKGEVGQLADEAFATFETTIPIHRQVEIYNQAIIEAEGVAALAAMQALINLVRDDDDPRSNINLLDD